MENIKELKFKGINVILKYSDNVFNSSPNDLRLTDYKEPQIIFPDGKKILLCINGEEYYCHESKTMIQDYYFEVVDFDENGEEIAVSYSIHDKIKNIDELTHIMTYCTYFTELF